VSDKAFVSLKSLAGKGPSSPQEVLAEIRRIYFKTTRQTIENDFDHAIDLLKSLPDEETRDRAAVYMEGLAQMKKEFAPSSKGKKQKAKGKREQEKGGQSPKPKA
jgi:hypothetical protein